MTSAMAGRFPDSAYAAVLFDLDSTLIDSAQAVKRSWMRWAEEFGVVPQHMADTHGKPAREIVAHVLAGRAQPEIDRAHVRICELEVADTEGIVALPGSVEAFETLTELGVPYAIVTSCDRELAGTRIAASGLPRPAVVVSASDVERGKPGPEPYLLGAQQLGFAAKECLVAEDAIAGLQSARAAGAGGVLAVTGTAPVEQLAEHADVVVSGLDAVTWNRTPAGLRIAAD